MKVCVLGDAQHCDEAKASSIPYMTVDDLKKFNKDKKLGKKFGEGVHACASVWAITFKVSPVPEQVHSY